MIVAMGSLLVFLPREARTDASALVDVDLDQLLLDEGSSDGLQFQRVDEGPGGGPGMMVAVNRPDAPAANLTYDATAQKWRAAAPEQAGCVQPYWLGCTIDDPPGPHNLARRQFLDYSEWAELGDGNRWRIPIAFHLDRRLLPDPASGADVKSVARPDDRLLANLALEIHGVYERAAALPDATDFYVPKTWAFAFELLVRNYRVTFDAVLLLGLFESDRAVVAATMSGLGIASVAKYQEIKSELDRLEEENWGESDGP